MIEQEPRGKRGIIMTLCTLAQIVLGIAIGVAIGAPSLVPAGDPPKATQEKHDRKAKAADTIESPTDCADIKAGTPDSRFPGRGTERL
jgi:hypothetical protein